MYKGLARDRLNQCNMETKWYATYKEAHDRAEALRPKGSNRYEILVKQKIVDGTTVYI